MTVDTRAAARKVEEEFLGRLGLDRGANPLAIETARDGIVGFLSAAPSDLRTWAQRQISLTDEAYAVLSDPTADFTAYVEQLPPAAPAARAVPAEVEVEDDGTVVASAPAVRPRTRNPFGGLSPLMKAVVSGVAIVAIVTGVYAVYVAGQTSVPGISGTPAPEASAATNIDQAQVAALMQKITANPKDVASYQQLADLYFQAQDFQNAIVFEKKVVELNGADATAHTALGAAYFNTGDATTAETEWLAATRIDPKNVEAHYDLGYLYLSQTPPNIAKTREQWNQVIALAPGSQVAQTVRTHLNSLDASPAPSVGAPGASGSSGTTGSNESAAPWSASSAPSASPAPSASN